MIMVGDKETGSPVLLVKDGCVWELRLDEVDTDVLGWLLGEHATAGGPVRGLSRRQVVALLGGPVPDDFFAADLEFGDENELVRGWFPETVRRYLSGERPHDPDAVSADVEEPAIDEAETATGTPAAESGESGPAATEEAQAWAYKSRRWTDIASVKPIETRMLIVTSYGVVTPGGWVAHGPLRQCTDLQELVAQYPWAKDMPAKPSPGERRVQIWITGEALLGAGFAIHKLRLSELPDKVAEAFGVTVKSLQSGWFTGSFPLTDGSIREVELVLMPFLGTQPSRQRPNDRGLAGIKGRDSYLPDDEVAAAHKLAERMVWQYSLASEGVMAAPRWADPAAQIAAPIIKRARPKAVNSKEAPPLKPCPLPLEITGGTKLVSRWWENWSTAADMPEGELSGIEVDQQGAYLPSAEEAFLGYGEPRWVDPDPSVYTLKRPPFQIAEIVVPAGKDCDGLSRRLPLPLPWMKWDEPVTGQAITTDVLQLLAAIDEGGAGLSIDELEFLRVYQWPEQHRWLRGPAEVFRKAQQQARAEGHQDRVDMIKAMFTSFFGKMSSVESEGAWKYPLLELQQPAWYWDIESRTRWRSLKHAVYIDREHGVAPYSVNRDAWIYRIPKGTEPGFLEDKRNDDATLHNGKYRVKNTWDVSE